MALSYKVFPGTPYYTTSALTTQAGTVVNTIPATYVNTTYGTVSIGGSTYYVAYGQMISFWNSSFTGPEIDGAVTKVRSASATPTSGGTGLFTTGGAYALETAIKSKAAKSELSDIVEYGQICAEPGGIAAGTFFYLAGNLVQAITAIGYGDTYISGTNYKTPTAGALNELKSAITPVVGKGINLLDNWYFVGGGSQQGGDKYPINQRGQTTYTGNSGTIDRWVTAENGSGWGGQIIVDASGIILKKTVSNKGVLICQRSELYTKLYGQQVTFSALCSDGLHSLTFVADPDVDYTDFGGGLEFVSNTSYPLTIAMRGGAVGDTSTIYAVKLELGDTQTIARQVNGAWVLNDPPPNYQQELAKCQRYLYVVDKLTSSVGAAQVGPIGYAGSSTQAYLPLNLPVNLRTGVNPTVSYGSASNMRLYKTAGGYINPTSVSLQTNTMTPGFLVLLVTVASGLTQGDTVVLTLMGEKLIISVEP